MKEKDLMNELNVMLARAIKEKYKRLFHGKPQRTTSIGKEDIINLKIALHCSKNLEEFLKLV